MSDTPRLLRQIGGLLLALLVSAVCLLLGSWQYHRHLEKEARREQVAARYDAPAVPLAQVLPDTSGELPARARWAPVVLTGRYDAAHTVLVRNRPLDGDIGYEVLVPLIPTGGGRALVVDRGWLPAGAASGEPDVVPQPPATEVSVRARLRSFEPGSRPGPPGQVLSIAQARLAADLPYPVLPAYGVLSSESPRPAEAPLLLPRPEVGLGPHLAYAVQWALFAVAAVLAWVVQLRRAHLLADGPPDAAPRDAGPPKAGGPTRTRPRLPGRRPARRTDEEVEDALCG